MNSFYRYPVNFNDESNTSSVVPPLKHFASKLRDEVPYLFCGEFTVITEYGRIYNAKRYNYTLTKVILFPAASS
jgi:hypothetical protein